MHAMLFFFFSLSLSLFIVIVGSLRSEESTPVLEQKKKKGNMNLSL